MNNKPVWCLAQCGDGDCVRVVMVTVSVGGDCLQTVLSHLRLHSVQTHSNHTHRGGTHTVHNCIFQKCFFLNNKKIFLKFILPSVKIGKSLCSYQLSALRYYRKVDTGLTFSICFKNNERASIIHCWEVCQLLDIRSNPIGHIPPGRLVNINHTE